ncbi:hypothetical protein CH330_03040 [candidate division WOR-3 bacterium JGI_Cruoil_03_51_56]|uniref:Secretion system C-terminal sorting domain-containing protein n=1 Tax=candidate division WOR-3 bacterium JGI_Cruoil_03_51_56 TaxID=1973747 RepID=A0A235BW03_UNCW3|nr:MAG: hypothetical protein CH330_03040 [candidate division WOR-3 bacterium JGI_Cruoil_03_51_56]
MKAASFLLIPALLCAQVIDTVIRFPSNVGELLYVPTGNKLYVKLRSPHLYILDCSTYAIRNIIPAEQYPWWPVPRGGWNWRRNKVYYAMGTDTAGLVVIDNATDSVTKWIDYPAYSRPVYNSLNDKVYALGVCDSSDLAVIDCETDSIVKFITQPYNLANFVVWDSVGNKVYVGSAGWTGADEVTVIDCETDSVVAIVHSQVRPDRAAYSYHQRKLYVGGEFSHERGAVIDCAADTLIRNLRVGEETWAPLVWNSIEDKVYWPGTFSSGDSISVISCKTDSVIGRVPVPDSCQDDTWWCCMLPWSNRLYFASDGYDSTGSFNYLTVLDCANDSVISQIRFGKLAEEIVCNPIDHLVYISDWWDSAVYVFRDEIPGVAEDPNTTVEPAEFAVRPNPACDRLHLGGRQPAKLYAITGRKVADLQPGENDIRHLAPGIYFVRWSSDRPTTKVVVHE